jgi:hypothetical protein
MSVSEANTIVGLRRGMLNYSKNWLMRAQQSREDSLRESKEFERFIQQYRISSHRSRKKKEMREVIALENNSIKTMLKKMYLENKKRPPH